MLAAAAMLAAAGVLAAAVAVAGFAAVGGFRCEAGGRGPGSGRPGPGGYGWRASVRRALVPGDLRLIPQALQGLPRGQVGRHLPRPRAGAPRRQARAAGPAPQRTGRADHRLGGQDGSPGGAGAAGADPFPLLAPLPLLAGPGPGDGVVAADRDALGMRRGRVGSDAGPDATAAGSRGSSPGLPLGSSPGSSLAGAGGSAAGSGSSIPSCHEMGDSPSSGAGDANHSPVTLSSASPVSAAGPQVCLRPALRRAARRGAQEPACRRGYPGKVIVVVRRLGIRWRDIGCSVSGCAARRAIRPCGTDQGGTTRSGQAGPEVPARCGSSAGRVLHDDSHSIDHFPCSSQAPVQPLFGRDVIVLAHPYQFVRVVPRFDVTH